MVGSYRVWRGSYFDGRVARRHPATVALTGAGVAIGLPESAEVWMWPFGEVRAVPSGIGEGARLERGGESPEVLVVEEGDFLDALAPRLPVGRRPSVAPADVHVPREAKVAGALAALFVLLIGAVLFYWRGIPALAERVAERVPVAWEDQLGAAVVEQIAPAGSTCGPVELVAALDAIVDRLVTTSPGDRYVYRVSILDDPALNALAAPGGHIVVFRGLIEAAESPEEVAGVLAHEIQHVRLRHGTQAVLREIPVQLVAAAIGGDVGGLGQIAGAAATLGSLRYRRADEEAADRGGMQMIRAARIAPDAMVRFFTRVEENRRRLPDLPSFLSTHPATRERIAGLERMAANAVYTPEPVLEGYDWENRAVECGA